MQQEAPYDPSIFVLAMTGLLFLILQRLPRPGLKRQRDMTLSLASLIFLVVTASSFWVARLDFAAVSSPFEEDIRETLFFLQWTLACLVIFGTVALLLNLVAAFGVEAQHRWLRALRLPMSWGAVFSWLTLSNAVPLVDESFGFWISMLGLSFAIMWGAVSLGDTNPNPWKISVGTFLLAGRVTMSPTANSDLVLAALLIGFIFWTSISVKIWLQGKDHLSTVLFLRRFGNSKLNTTISNGIREWGKPRARLIALDDQDLAPAGGNRRPLLVAVAIAATAICPPLIGVGIVVSKFDELFGVAEATLDGQGIVVGFVALTIVGLVAFAPFIIFLLWRRRQSVLRGQLDINRIEDIDRICATFRSLKAGYQRRFLLKQPQTLVVRSSHELWKASVLTFMKIADTIVIDLSDVSMNIQWELDRLGDTASPDSLILISVPLDRHSPVIQHPSSARIRLVQYSCFEDLAIKIRKVQPWE